MFDVLACVAILSLSATLEMSGFFMTGDSLTIFLGSLWWKLLCRKNHDNG